MRVAFPMRVDVFDKPGGDLRQIQKYIELGKQRNSSGQYGFVGEIIHDFTADLSSYDLIHLTNLDRPVDLHSYALMAATAKKRIVISTIHHSYEEIDRYERLGRGRLIGRVFAALGFQRAEVIRSLARCIRYPQLAVPTIKVIFKSVRRSQKVILDSVHRIVVLSNKEKLNIQQDCGSIDENKFVLIRNGFEYEVQRQTQKDIDVCVVGRIEARKNQLSILQALNRLEIKGIFVGEENPNHRSYCAKFRDEIARSKSEFVQGVNHSKVLEIMQRARVHISASWFEVSSLVDLEAHCSKCHVVSSVCGSTNEILGETAIYVSPSSEKEIEDAIALALLRSKCESPGNRSAGDSLGVSWEEIGGQLVAMYQEVLREASAPVA